MARHNSGAKPALLLALAAALVLGGGLLVVFRRNGAATALSTVPSLNTCSRYRCPRLLQDEVPQLTCKQPQVEQLRAILAAGPSYFGYFTNVKGDMVEYPSLWFSSLLSHFQLKNCITGAIGEIGTHYGRYFYSLATASLASEPKVAVDLFEDQSKNIDGSGGASVDSNEFKATAQALNVTNLHVMSQDSATLTVGSWVEKGLPPFRIFSVDGAHHYEGTVRDLRLAYCSIRRDGVIIVDDWDNMQWTGVIDGTFAFLHETPDLVPFLYMCNKLYLTTRAYHSMYFNFVASNPCTPCSFKTLIGDGTHAHESRYSIMGAKVCVVLRENVDCKKKELCAHQMSP